MKKFGPKRLSDLLQPLLAPALQKHGIATSQLITNWPEIAGTELANVTRPLRITWPKHLSAEVTGLSQNAGGTLVMQCESGFALDVQHKAPQMLERINALYGWAAIAKITLRQGPVDKAEKAIGLKSPVVAGEPSSALMNIEDEGLRKALNQLAANIAYESRAKSSKD